MKKIFRNRFITNTLILFSFTLIMEFIIRVFTEASFKDFAVVRIVMSSLIISLIFGFIGHFLPKLGQRLLNIFYVLFVGIYGFVEFGLYNFIGFFMGIGNAEQGTKVTSYILDFLKALKPVYWTILIPTVIYLFYFIIFDRKVWKNKTRNKTLNIIQKISIEVYTATVILALITLYFYTVKDDKYKNDLQTESNYSLWLYPENSNLAANNFGYLIYGYCDIKSQIFGIDADYVSNLENKVVKKDNEEENKTIEEEVVTDNTRTIDDTAWNKVIENEKDASRNKLNNYFINRKITDKNEYTGIFEGKNLIIILMESVNEISIMNEEYFPTLYKLYNEGISFRNNFTPRNCCSTGNNEFTVLSSLFTINNTCTANTYANNTYFEGAFNLFKNAGYYTTSYHDYTQKYYKRRQIHRGLGSSKFYTVTDLGIPYNDKYEEWPSDVLLMKQSREHYMNEDKFMTYMAAVTTHQTYNVPSEMGDLYRKDFEALGYSKSLSRYLSKMKVFDTAIEELLNELEEAGKLEDTVIALFGDHFPYGLTDSQINEFLKKNNAAYTVSRNSTVNKDVDRTPLIIYNSGIEGVQVEDYTTIIDLLPTLLNMFNIDYDPRLYLGTDIFSSDHVSRAVFADGSWQNELGYYHAPNSKMNYLEGAEALSNEELKSINSEISTRQRMSATAIKSNYFKYLGNELNKYKEINNDNTLNSEEDTLE